MSLGKRYAILAGLAVVLVGRRTGGVLQRRLARARETGRQGPGRGAGGGGGRAAAKRPGAPAGDRQRRGLRLGRGEIARRRPDPRGAVPRRPGSEEGRGPVQDRCASVRGGAQGRPRRRPLRDIASRDQAASQETRYQELLDKNFVSKEAYAQYRTNAQTADATARASQAALENAKLNLEYTVIRSPIDGYVGRALLQAGNMVKANDTISLVVINQVKPVYVSFAIPEQQLADVRELMRKGPLTVEVAAPGSDKALADGPHRVPRQRGRPDHRHDQGARHLRQRATRRSGPASSTPCA